MPPIDPEMAARLNEIIATHAGREGPLLPILHDIQAEYGFIPEPVQPRIAVALGMTRAEVHGVVTFYHDFRAEPAGAHVLRLCRAEACKSMGADQLAAQVRKALGIDWHQTTADGRITLEPVFCLGLCACAPSAQLGDRLIGRADAADLVAMAQEGR
ncbi:formate dehydrogenase subunit gamma [Paracoccus pacificus]|uniref:Formate dehydrogenase subunit gamma n=1 Tax=Paracoccus pacificus TaxID=1463598 RepID=A0ABW4R8Q1_9RHOB